VGEHAGEEQSHEEQGSNFVHVCKILEKTTRKLNIRERERDKEMKENMCLLGCCRNL